MTREEVADKCPNCGAPVYSDKWGSYKCKYCGTKHQGKYGIEIDGVRGQMLVRARSTVPGHVLRHITSNDDLNYIEEVIKGDLVQSLAEGLVEHMTYRYCEDMATGDLTIEGSLHVKTPDKYFDKQFMLKDLHELLKKRLEWRSVR